MSQNEAAAPPSAFGYSSNIRLLLEVGDQTYTLGQIGPNAITLRDPLDLPPCDADVVMFVDGKERRWPVTLPNGASSSDRNVATIDR